MGLIHFGARTHAQRARTREFFILIYIYFMIKLKKPDRWNGLASVLAADEI